MTTGPRDHPYPLILHVNSQTGNPAKLAEASAIYVNSVSAVILSATTVCATNWVGIPGGPGTTDHGTLTGLLDNDHPQYVLSATNADLSSVVSNHLTSAVHWDANTLDARFINASGDNAAGAFYFGNLSAATFSATTISATNAYIASTVQFNIGITPTLSVGQMSWNSTDQTIDIQTTTDTTLQVGQEQVILVDNDSGATIPNGKVVYVSGSTGGSGKLRVALASASSITSETAFIIGVATQNIPHPGTGFVTTFGKVNGIPLPTAQFTDGDIAYLGDTPGELVNYRPSKPSHGYFQMGRVIRAHDSNGILFVTIRGSVDMAEIHDVASATPNNGQVLVWNSTSGLYEPKNVSAISGINNYATTGSLANYATTASLANYTPTASLASYATTASLANYALTASLVNYATTASLNSYVLTSVNTNLSSLVTNLQTSTASVSSVVSNHLASAVHWDANTLDARFINASGDSVTGSFTFGNVTGTTVCATTYINLPSALATWNASALQGRPINTTLPGIGEVLTWDNTNSRWTPSAVAAGGVTNNPGGNTGNIQFKNGTSFSGTDNITYDSTLSALYSKNFSSLSVTATNISATTYLNLPSVTALNGTGVFEVTSYSRSNYVLTSTNLALSNTVTGHLASAVHWDLATLNTNYINASGDSANANFFFSSLSATNFSATTYFNLPSVTALNGTGVFEVTSYSRSNYVLTSTNLALSNTVTGHLASAVHWDLATLNTNYINASGDSANANFFFSSLSATNFSATTYSNLPSVTALNGTGVFEVTSYSRSNYVLTSTNLALSNTVTGHLASAVHWDLATLNTNYINASGDSANANFFFSSLSATNLSATTYLNLPSGTAAWNAIQLQGISVCSTAPTTTNQNIVYDSTAAKWKPGYTVYQSTAIPNNSIGANGDIYFQYDQSGYLSGLADVQITATPSTGQVLVWSSTKWAPSSITAGGGAAAQGANYRLQFYNNGQLSSVTGLEFAPDLFGSPQFVLSGGIKFYAQTSIYSPNINTNTLGIYDPTGNILNIQSNVNNTINIVSLSSTGVSALTISAAAYVNLPTSALSGLSDTQITTTPTLSSVLKWNGTKWVAARDATGTSTGGSPGGTTPGAIQFLNDTATGFDANDDFNYAAKNLNLHFGSAGQLNTDNIVVSENINSDTASVNTSFSVGNVTLTQLGAGNLKVVSGLITSGVSSLTISATTYQNLPSGTATWNANKIQGIDTSAVNNTTLRIASSIFIPSAIIMGSAIPSTATQIAGIYYAGQSAQNAPPAIYQCNQDNLNIYANFAQGKSIRLIDQITPAGGFAASGYEFDGDSFIIQHGATASAVLTVPKTGVLVVASAVSATNVSANNLIQLIAASAAGVSASVNTTGTSSTLIFTRNISDIATGDIIDVDINGTFYLSGAVATVTPVTIFNLGPMSATIADGTTVASGAATQTSYWIQGSYSVNSVTSCFLNMKVYRGTPVIAGAAASLATNTQRHLWSTSSVSVTGSRDFTFYFKGANTTPNQQFVLHNYKITRSKSQ